jgi:hypothetical protein
MSFAISAVIIGATAFTGCNKTGVAPAPVKKVAPAAPKTDVVTSNAPEADAIVPNTATEMKITDFTADEQSKIYSFDGITAEQLELVVNEPSTASKGIFAKGCKSNSTETYSIVSYESGTEQTVQTVSNGQVIETPNANMRLKVTITGLSNCKRYTGSFQMNEVKPAPTETAPTETAPTENAPTETTVGPSAE